MFCQPSIFPPSIAAACAATLWFTFGTVSGSVAGPARPPLGIGVHGPLSGTLADASSLQAAFCDVGCAELELSAVSTRQERHPRPLVRDRSSGTRVTAWCSRALRE